MVTLHVGMNCSGGHMHELSVAISSCVVDYLLHWIAVALVCMKFLLCFCFCMLGYLGYNA